jgi:hypothetical protein
MQLHTGATKPERLREVAVAFAYQHYFSPREGRPPAAMREYEQRSIATPPSEWTASRDALRHGPARRLPRMPCLIALFALIGPRIALLFTWLFSNMISRAIDSWIVAILGFLLLPWTTLAYVVFYDVGAGREVAGLEWFLVGLAFVADIGSYVGGRSARD